MRRRQNSCVLRSYVCNAPCLPDWRFRLRSSHYCFKLAIPQGIPSGLATASPCPGDLKNPLAPGCRRHWIRNGTICPTGHRAAALEEPVRFPQPIFLTCTFSGVKQMKCPVTAVSFVLTPSLRLKFSRSDAWVSHVSVIFLRWSKCNTAQKLLHGKKVARPSSG